MTSASPANADSGVDSPIQDKRALVEALAVAVASVVDLCVRYDVDLDELRVAKGFEFTALRAAAVESLHIDNDVRTEFLGAAQQAHAP